MPELNTVPLERGLFDVMVKRLRVTPGKPAPTNMLGVVTLRGRGLPSLAGYELGAGMDLSLSARLGGDSFALFGAAERLWSLALAEGLRAVVSLAPSGRKFDVEDGCEIELTFGWDTFDSYVEISVGKYSDGHTDFAVRASIFDSLLRCACLSDQISIIVDNGVLRIKSDTFTWLNCRKCEYPEKHASEMRFFRLNFVQFDGTNFSNLGIYFPTMGESVLIARRMLTDYVGSASIVDVRLNMGVLTLEKYECLRTVIPSILPDAAWTTMFHAKQRYGIDDISGAFDDLSGFLMTLYTAKIPKVGPVDVAVNHADGCTQMSFIFEKSTSKAYDAVRAFAAELAGGRDVIESTE